MKCPPGQTFDGEFCQVDQSVATAEQRLDGTGQEGTGQEGTEDEEPGAPDESSDAPVEGEPKPSGSDNTQDEGPTEEGNSDTPPEKATPVDVTMAAQAGPVIQYLASSHLPSGAKQMGAPFAGQFAQGQILEQKVQLSAGKCYTVVAAGLPPISEVNLELFVEGEDEPVARDDTKGVQAVLGSRNACFKPGSSGPFKLVLSVEKGNGVAAAQVFQK